MGRDEAGTLLPRAAAFSEEQGGEHLSRCLAGTQRDCRTMYWPLDFSSSEVVLPGLSTPGPEPGVGQSKYSP